MINCNENKNHNERYIIPLIDLDNRHEHKYAMQNIACFGDNMTICNKQHLRNISGSIH